MCRFAVAAREWLEQQAPVVGVMGLQQDNPSPIDDVVGVRYIEIIEAWVAHRLGVLNKPGIQLIDQGMRQRLGERFEFVHGHHGPKLSSIVGILIVQRAPDHVDESPSLRVLRLDGNMAVDHVRARAFWFVREKLGSTTMADMERICRRFTSHMHRGVCAIKASGFKPKRSDAWIEKLVVLFALEHCRDLISGEGDPIRCHFTLGNIPKDEVAAKVRAAVESVRGFNMKDPAATTLSEYLVDFSFSAYSLKHILGTKVVPPGGKFRLLLAAESEMSFEHRLVIDDFVKLLEIKSPVKVVVFQSRTGERRTALAQAFQDIIRRHGRYDPVNEPRLVVHRHPTSGR